MTSTQMLNSSITMIVANSVILAIMRIILTGNNSTITGRVVQQILVIFIMLGGANQPRLGLQALKFIELPLLAI